jgi:hypothetical protein
MNDVRKFSTNQWISHTNAAVPKEVKYPTVPAGQIYIPNESSNIDVIFPFRTYTSKKNTRSDECVFTATSAAAGAPLDIEDPDV